MEPNQAGVTALVTAYARAYHATHDSPKIFDDFLADQYYSAGEHTEFNQNLTGLLHLVDPAMAARQPEPATALARVMQLHLGPITLSRSRYTEDCLEEAVRQSARQYVILGAGFDTFAFRRPDLLDYLRVFEVDHPVTQAMKYQRITAAGWQTPAQLHFAPIDFNREDLQDALRHTPYDPRQASFFSWQGVTFYLPCEAVFATLRSIAEAAPAGSQVIFDYMDHAAFNLETAGKRIRLMQQIASMVGEPIQTGFDPRRLGDELALAGFDLIETLSPDQIEACYFLNRADDYHAFEYVHFARATVR